MNLLVDSSIWISTLGDKGVPGFVDYVDRARTKHQIVTTGMITLEVLLGAESWNQLLELQLHFETLRGFEPTSQTWVDAGRMAMRMRSSGFRLRAQDLLIARVAIENNLTLVHADRDFEPLAEHEGLKTESLLHFVE